MTPKVVNLPLVIFKLFLEATISEGITKEFSRGCWCCVNASVMFFQVPRISAVVIVVCSRVGGGSCNMSASVQECNKVHQLSLHTQAELCLTRARFILPASVQLSSVTPLLSHSTGTKKTLNVTVTQGMLLWTGNLKETAC